MDLFQASELNLLSLHCQPRTGSTRVHIFEFSVRLIEEHFHIRREKELDKLLCSWPPPDLFSFPHSGALRALFSIYEMFFNKNLSSVPASFDSLGSKH